jgi:hypothetical protein
MSAEAFWLFAPEEVAHGGAAACTYVSYDAFSQYVRDHVYGCPGAAVDVAGPQDLVRLMQGCRTAWPAQRAVAESEDAMGPVAREALRSCARS